MKKLFLSGTGREASAEKSTFIYTFSFLQNTFFLRERTCAKKEDGTLLEKAFTEKRRIEGKDERDEKRKNKPASCTRHHASCIL